MKDYVIQRETKKIKIVVRPICESWGKIAFRVCDIQVLPKGKRRWVSLSSDIRDDYSFRSLDTEGKKKYIKNKFLSIVTNEEIEKAVQKAYEQLKPKTDEIDYWCY